MSVEIDPNRVEISWEIRKMEKASWVLLDIHWELSI